MFLLTRGTPIASTRLGVVVTAAQTRNASNWPHLFMRMSSYSFKNIYIRDRATTQLVETLY